MAAIRSSLLSVGLLYELCRAAERHDADPRARRMVVDEGFRGDLCRGDPVGLYVGCAHTERHIDCQNDGTKLRRQGHDRGRSGDGSQSGCQREQHQRRRNERRQVDCALAD